MAINLVQYSINQFIYGINSQLWEGQSKKDATKYS